MVDTKQLINTLFGVVSSLFTSNGQTVQGKVEIPLPIGPTKPEAEEPKKEEPVLIELDWNNPESHINKRFKVKEALYLHSWDAYHSPSDAEKEAIVAIANKVDAAVDLLETELKKKLSVNIHAWIRPGKAHIPGSKWDGHDYNRYIYETQVWAKLTPEEKAKKHVPDSPHKTGHAVDFHVVGYEGPENCAKIRHILIPHLEVLGIRMEDITGGWIHNDDLPVTHSRFFKP